VCEAGSESADASLPGVHATAAPTRAVIARVSRVTSTVNPANSEAARLERTRHAHSLALHWCRSRAEGPARGVTRGIHAGQRSLCLRHARSRLDHSVRALLTEIDQSFQQVRGPPSR